MGAGKPAPTGSKLYRPSWQHKPQRQTYTGFKPSAAAVTQLDIATMHGGNPLDDRQPQPRTFTATGTVTADKRVEDIFQLRRINPCPPVHHTQHHIRRADITRYVSRNLHVFASMVQGIADQVVEQTLHRYPT